MKELTFAGEAVAVAPARISYWGSGFRLPKVLISLVALLAAARSSSADVTINFTGFADAQLVSVYQSQGWDVGSEAWYMGGSGGPYYVAYEFRTIAAGDPFYSAADAIYAPYGQAWFVQIHTGLSFVPDGDSVTIASLGTGGATSFEVVGFSGSSEVLEETISTTLAFPGYVTIRVSDPSLTPVTLLEFAPARPLNYQIISLDVGTMSQIQPVPEPSSLLVCALAVALAGGIHAMRSRVTHRVRAAQRRRSSPAASCAARPGGR